QLHRVSVGILEIDPSPAGQRAVVDAVHRAVEWHPARGESLVFAIDVLDMEGDVGGPDLVLRRGHDGVRPRGPVLQDLEPGRTSADRKERHAQGDGWRHTEPAGKFVAFEPGR